MCCRDELWRWFTYALMHQGWAHLAINVTMQLAVGFFLEVINGPLRIFYLYLMGIIGGSLAASVFDSTANVVGCSGAVYSILGAWVASLTINWCVEAWTPSHAISPEVRVCVEAKGNVLPCVETVYACSFPSTSLRFLDYRGVF